MSLQIHTINYVELTNYDYFAYATDDHRSSIWLLKTDEELKEALSYGFIIVNLANLKTQMHKYLDRQFTIRPWDKEASSPITFEPVYLYHLKFIGFLG